MNTSLTHNIEGKIIVVTGASSGLGEDVTNYLHKCGAKLIIGARRQERLDKIAEKLSLPAGAAVKTDVTDFKQVQHLVDQAISLYGRIDVLINNAGIMPLSMLEKGDIKDWDQIIDVNIKGVLYGIAAALPYMKKQKSGQIINVASVAGHRVLPGSTVYSASKSAVRVISEGLRKEVKPYHLRTTIISPGAVKTELPESITDQGKSLKTREFYKETAVEASSFSRCVAFAIRQPDDIDVNEILYRPTKEVP